MQSEDQKLTFAEQYAFPNQYAPELLQKGLTGKQHSPARSTIRHNIQALSNQFSQNIIGLITSDTAPEDKRKLQEISKAFQHGTTFIVNNLDFGIRNFISSGKKLYEMVTNITNICHDDKNHDFLTNLYESYFEESYFESKTNEVFKDATLQAKLLVQFIAFLDIVSKDPEFALHLSRGHDSQAGQAISGQSRLVAIINTALQLVGEKSIADRIQKIKDTYWQPNKNSQLLYGTQVTEPQTFSEFSAIGINYHLQAALNALVALQSHKPELFTKTFVEDILATRNQFIESVIEKRTEPSVRLAPMLGIEIFDARTNGLEQLKVLPAKLSRWIRTPEQILALETPLPEDAAREVALKTPLPEDNEEEQNEINNLPEGQEEDEINSLIEQLKEHERKFMMNAVQIKLTNTYTELFKNELEELNASQKIDAKKRIASFTAELLEELDNDEILKALNNASEDELKEYVQTIIQEKNLTLTNNNPLEAEPAINSTAAPSRSVLFKKVKDFMQGLFIKIQQIISDFGKENTNFLGRQTTLSPTGEPNFTGYQNSSSPLTAPDNNNSSAISQRSHNNCG